MRLSIERDDWLGTFSSLLLRRDVSSPLERRVYFEREGAVSGRAHTRTSRRAMVANTTTKGTYKFAIMEAARMGATMLVEKMTAYVRDRIWALLQ